MRAQSTVRNVIILLLLLVVFVAPFSPVPRFLSFVVAPIERPLLIFGDSLQRGFRLPITAFRSKKALLKENNELQSRVATLLGASLENISLRAENDRLRSMLGRDQKKSDFILGTVLAGESRSFYGSIIIDAGTNDGISVGDMVFANKSLAIGRVEEAGTRISKVRLFSRNNEKTEAFIDSLKVELTGRGGGVYYTELPRESEMRLGDAVRLAPSLATTENPAPVLGYVAKIDNKDDNLNIYAESGINMRSLEQVFVKRP